MEKKQKGGIAKSKITMSELAKLAGVSDITVSRAMRPSSSVKPRTRERILALAKEHGYQMNLPARNLKLNRSYTIAVVVEMNPTQERMMSEPYPMALLGGISQALTSAGYSLLLTTLAGINTVMFQSAEGVILLGQGADDEAVKALNSLSVPLVVWGAKHDNADYCIVGSDNYHGGEVAAERLVALGRRKLVFLGDTRHAEIAAREKGFRDTAKLGGAEIIASIPCPFTFVGGLDAAQNLINQGIKFDGVLGTSDLQAMGFSRALIENGARIPEQVSVIGYDDTPLAATFSPALTSVHQNWRDGGEMLAKKIMSLISGGDASSELLPTILTLRQT